MSLNQLEQWLGDHAQTDLPPVESWHPEHCGDMDMVIRRDGSWWHEGTEMRRKSLVRLFSRILRLDGEDYVLVTPAEKIRIQVEDTPFVAILGEWKDGVLSVMTQAGDLLEVGEQHPITLQPLDGEMLPVVEVRRGLKARIGRNLYYQLAEIATELDGQYVITSHGKPWPVA